MAAEVSGVTFHDLRGTAVLRLFLAGGTEAEIATITGHSLRDVRSILDSHYFCREPALEDRCVLGVSRAPDSPLFKLVGLVAKSRQVCQEPKNFL